MKLIKTEKYAAGRQIDFLFREFIEKKFGVDFTTATKLADEFEKELVNLDFIFLGLGPSFINSKLVYNEEKEKLAARGLYNQPQGDERRTGPDSLNEVFLDNEVSEGEHVAHMRALAKSKNLQAISLYMEELKRKGHSDHRIQSMLSRAMSGVRI